MTRSAKSAATPPPPPVVKPGDGGLIANPHDNDVLCGRGGRINSHEGNVRFRDLVQALKPSYLNPATKKVEKAVIAAEVVSRIRSMSPPGRFMKEDGGSGMWMDIGDERARKKAGQALREDAPDIRAEMVTVDETNQQQTPSPQEQQHLMVQHPGSQAGFDYTSQYNPAIMSTHGGYSPGSNPGFGGYVPGRDGVAAPVYHGMGLNVSPTAMGYGNAPQQGQSPQQVMMSHPYGQLPNDTRNMGRYGNQAYGQQEQHQQTSFLPLKQQNQQPQHHYLDSDVNGCHMGPVAGLHQRSEPDSHESMPPPQSRSHLQSRPIYEPSDDGRSKSPTEFARSNFRSSSRKGIMNKFFKPHEISSHQRHGQDKEQDCDRPDSASFGGSGVFSSSTTNGSALSYLRDLSFSSHRTSGEPSGDATADRVQSSAMDHMNSGSEGGGHKRQHEPNSSRIGSIMQDLPDKTSSHSQDAEVSSESAEVSYLRRLSPINSVADPDENKSHGSSSAAGHNPLLASSPVKDDSDIILPSNFDSIIGMKRSNSFPHIGSVSDVDMLSISDSFFDDARSSIIGGGNDGGSSITGSLRSRRGGSSGIVSGSLRRPGGSTANPVYSSGISTVSFNLRDEPESFCDQHRYTPPEPGSYARSVRANRINQAANSSTMSANSVSGMSVKSGGSESDDGDASSSGKSHTSSWLKPFKGTQPVSQSDFSSWVNESQRSLLSDMSADLMALDLHTDLPSSSRPPFRNSSS